MLTFYVLLFLFLNVTEQKRLMLRLMFGYNTQHFFSDVYDEKDYLKE